MMNTGHVFLLNHSLSFIQYRSCVYVQPFIFFMKRFHVNFQCPLLHNFYVQITWYRLIVPRTTECPGGMLGDPVCVREYFWGGIVLILVVKTLNTVWGRVSLHFYFDVTPYWLVKQKRFRVYCDVIANKMADCDSR